MAVSAALGGILAGPVLFPTALFDDVALSALLFACLLIGRQKIVDALHSRGLWLLFALLGWMLVSLFWSDGVSPVTVLVDWLPGAVSVLLFVLLLQATEPERLGNVLLAVAMFVSAIALLSMFWQFSVLDRAFAWRSFRIYGAGMGWFANLYNPIDAGLFYGVFTVVVLHRLMTASGLRQVLPLFFVLLPLLLYMGLTYSRGALVSLLAAALVTSAMIGKRQFLTLLAILSAVGLALAIFGDALVEAEVDKGFNGRIPLWFDALDLIQQKPWLGHGLGQVFEYVIPPKMITYPFPHNYLMTLWVHYGVVGVGLFLGLLGYCGISCWRYRHQPEAVLAAGLLTFGFMGIQSYVDELVRLPHQYWLLIWLPVGFRLRRRCPLPVSRCP